MTVALATAQPQPLAPSSNPFEPQSLPQAMDLAKTIASSGLVPSSLRGKPGDVLIILMTARELGIGPMQALSDINVIQGKPVFSADLMVAQCKRRKDRCEWFMLIESTDDHATYEAKAVGAPNPERYTFNLENARGLNLLDKDNWKKQPRTMLRRRAAAACAREVFPDLVRGYDPDEAEDFARRPVVSVQPPQETPYQHVNETPQEGEIRAPAEEAEKVVTAPRKAANPKALQLWSRLVTECKEDKKSAMEKFEAASRSALGEKVPPTSEWTDEDVAKVEKVLFDIAF
jgi:hypothetical protein